MTRKTPKKAAPRKAAAKKTAKTVPKSKSKPANRTPAKTKNAKARRTPTKSKGTTQAKTKGAKAKRSQANFKGATTQHTIAPQTSGSSKTSANARSAATSKTPRSEAPSATPGSAAAPVQASNPSPSRQRPNPGRILPVKPTSSDTPQAPEMTLADDPVASEMARLLRESLTPSSLLIKNLTRQHKGHAEAEKHGGGHYSLYIVSDVFTGLKSIQRQQWVYSLLDDLLKTKRIHALEMNLKDNDEVSTLG